MSRLSGRSRDKRGVRGTRATDLLRHRLMSRSDVKRAQCAGRSHNRALMRGGRT